MDVHGIIFDDECNGEAVNLGGVATERCEMVFAPGRDDLTGRLSLSAVRGKIVEIRKVFGTSSCLTEGDRGLLDLNRGRPFIRATAKMLDDQYTKVYADLIAQRLLRWTAEGQILERTAEGIARATLSLVRLHAASAREFRVFPGLG